MDHKPESLSPRRRLTKRRQLLAWAGATTLGILTAACAGTPSTPTPAPQPTATPAPAAKPAAPTPAPAKPAPAATATPATAAKPAAGATQLVHTVWGTPGEKDLWEKFAEDYTRDNPKVFIKSEHIARDYEQVIGTRAAGGTAPDVMNMQDEPFPFWVKRNIYLNLQPYVNADSKQLKLEDFIPFTLESFRFNVRTNVNFAGDQYAMPWDGGPVLIFYNIDMFEKQEVPLPPDDGNWTYADFLERSRKLTKYDSAGKFIHGALAFPTWWVYSENWIWSWGGDFFNENQTECLLDRPEAKAALQELQDYRHKHKISPLGSEVAGQGTTDLFASNKIAMFWSGPWSFPDLRPLKIRWDVAHAPKGPGGKRFVRASYDGQAIWQNSKHKDEAWGYIKFVLSDEGQSRIAKLGRAMPARLSIAKSDSFVRPDTPQHEDRFVQALEYQHLQPIAPTYHLYDQVMAYYYEAMTGPDKTPVPQTLDKVKKITDQILKTEKLPESWKL